MSWLFSQALVEEYLPESCSDGEQSAPLSGSRTQQAYCAPDKMTDFSRLSQFGMTYKPLTESRGEALLMSYLGDFRAKTSAQQEKAQELTEKEVECGERWRASFTKYNLYTHSWKTHQCSLLGDLEEFSETWPQWGLMRDGECWEQRTLEQTIRGTEFGLSPNGVDSFHTPNTTGLDGGSNSRKALKKKLEKYPTPNTGMYRNLNYNKELCIKRAEKHQTDLAMVSIMKFGGQLNPTWVEWLMGWPLQWTDLKPLVMDKSPSVQQPLGEC
jgi:hypothetical protein